MAEVHVFIKNNCRVLHNPPDLESLRKLPNVVVDPDLSQVHGVEMEYRKLVDGKVLPMTAEERDERKASYVHTPVITSIAPVKAPVEYKMYVAGILAIAAAAAIAFLIK